MYNGSAWYRLAIYFSESLSSGIQVPFTDHIIWNWNPVAGANGDKWSANYDFDQAQDMGLNTTMDEQGLVCGTSYDRYVWAYDDRGSTATMLNQSTLGCSLCGSSITVNHLAGDVAPVDKTVTYGIVSNIPGEFSIINMTALSEHPTLNG